MQSSKTSLYRDLLVDQFAIRPYTVIFSYFYFSQIFLRMSGGQHLGTQGNFSRRLCCTIQPERRSGGVFLRLSDGDTLGIAGILRTKDAVIKAPFRYPV